MCAPKDELYRCDQSSMSCIKAEEGGIIKEDCEANCGRFSPLELLGLWRGLMVKEGGLSNFDMGEFDLSFGERNLTVLYPNRT
jgi:hypothetical protein